MFVPRLEEGATSSRRSARTSPRAIPNNYRLVREAIDRGVPLEEVKPRQQDHARNLRKLIAPQAGQGRPRDSAAGLMKKLKLSLRALTGADRRRRKHETDQAWPAASPHDASLPEPRAGCGRGRRRRRPDGDVRGRSFPEPEPAPAAPPAAPANPLLVRQVARRQGAAAPPADRGDQSVGAGKAAGRRDARSTSSSSSRQYIVSRAAGAQHPGAQRLRLRNPRRDDRASARSSRC